jgi:hypothetical protein
MWGWTATTTTHASGAGVQPHQGPLLKAAYLELEMQWDDLGPLCSCFSAVFFSRKTEKPKTETNGKLFNWLLKR